MSENAGAVQQFAFTMVNGSQETLWKRFVDRCLSLVLSDVDCYLKDFESTHHYALYHHCCMLLSIRLPTN